jgi:hypothetical protein
MMQVATRAVSLPIVVAVTLVAALPGCSRPVKLVPAEGVVEIGGKPANGIVVQFLPQPVEGEKRPTSFATTGEDGSFQLLTNDGKPGAVEGTHNVILADTLEERPAQGSRATRAPRLDSRFTTMAGGLTATVSDGGGPIKLKVPAAAP